MFFRFFIFSLLPDKNIKKRVIKRLNFLLICYEKSRERCAIMITKPYFYII